MGPRDEEMILTLSPWWSWHGNPAVWWHLQHVVYAGSLEATRAECVGTGWAAGENEAKDAANRAFKDWGGGE